jgi:branched-chain amino acid transport system ATP-binding protein
VSDVLVLDGVSKSFGGLEAITDLSLTVPAGAIVAVIGANGAGKTTLFDLITGLCRPDSGQIRFMGRSLTGLRADQVCAAGIARTFHPVQPFAALSVADSVMVAALLRAPEPAEARRRTLDLLELLDLAGLADRLSGGLGVSARQRLELARALATRPRLLLLDELLAELEPAEIRSLCPVLHAFNQRPGLTIILAEPRLSTVLALATRVVMLDHGQVVADAAPETLTGAAAEAAATRPESDPS